MEDADAARTSVFCRRRAGRIAILALDNLLRLGRCVHTRDCVRTVECRDAVGIAGVVVLLG